MTLALRQSLDILQMTQQELNEWLEAEVEKNPLLEFKPASSSPRIEIDPPGRESLHEFLEAQIRDHFPNPDDRLLATKAQEMLDEKGFLSEGFLLPERILARLQSFEPAGIFARNLQEALLIQLKAKGKADSLAFILAKECFDDLLHGRYSAIKKKLRVEDLASAINELSRLSMRPGSAFHEEPAIPICPDLYVDKVEGGWTLQLSEDDLPQVHLSNEYLALAPATKEEKESLRTFKTGAKWLFRSLARRRKLLKDIGHILLCKQTAYLELGGTLNTLTIKEVAEKLEIHESTLSRALSGKHISTPQGILPLRSLFTSAPETKAAREILARLVQEEDKKKPLTDDELAAWMKAKGFPMARRTIAKYRTQLKIGSASQRKHSS